MKRIRAIMVLLVTLMILTFAIIVTGVPTVFFIDTTYAQETSDISDEGWYGDFRYVKSTYDDWLSCIEIVEYKPSEETDTIEILDAIEKWSVVIIGESAFEGVAAERIVVPDSVKEIKKGAFANSQINEVF